MKKSIYFFILCILVAFILSSCAGMEDWTSTALPGGYRVVRCSVHDIILCDRDSAVVIGAEIYQICWNDSYICVQWEDLETHGEDEAYWDEPHGEISYFILNVETGMLSEPYTQSEFVALGISDLCPWTRPKDLPRT